MNDFIARLHDRLLNLSEDNTSSYKNPNDPNYDRQYAEDALYHTIGPLTDSPRWSGKWTSKSSPTPDFVPNGPAPRWTPEEVVYAYAGDPNLIFSSRDNPKSPRYGPMGGSPLYRLAKKIARKYARINDKSFIADMYSNGFIPLVRMMQPGFDEGRSPFISYVARSIEGAVEHGTGGTLEGILAMGGESAGYGKEGSEAKEATKGLKGLTHVLSLDNPTAEELRNIANQVKGKYQTQKSHDKNPDNPFGGYSSRFYQIISQYADAVESEDQDMIEAAQNKVQQLLQTIEDESAPIRGASTGMGQAISTGSRKDHIGIVSMDAPKGTDGTDSIGPSLGEVEGESWVDPESVRYILDVALKHDLGAVVAKSPKLTEMVKQLSGKEGLKVGGKLTASELRYVLRGMGPLGSNYPGEGNVRSSLNIPRDAPGWWKPLEDPEIEPIPSGGLWNSAWKRNGHPQMGSTAVAEEMTNEIGEFNKLGIATARVVRTKAKGKVEAVSKVAVNTALQSALIKLKLIALLHRQHLGMDESLILSEIPILENYDLLDRKIIAGTADYIVESIIKMINDDAQLGWSKVYKPKNLADPRSEHDWKRHLKRKKKDKKHKTRHN